jgi:hypothetical protein
MSSLLVCNLRRILMELFDSMSEFREHVKDVLASSLKIVLEGKGTDCARVVLLLEDEEISSFYLD